MSELVIANLHRRESLLGGKNEIKSKREDSAMYGKWNYSFLLPTGKFKDGITADTFEQEVVAIFEAPESTDEPISRLSNRNLQYFVPIRARQNCLSGCHHHYYGPAGSFAGRLQPRDLMSPPDITLPISPNPRRDGPTSDESLPYPKLVVALLLNELRRFNRPFVQR